MRRCGGIDCTQRTAHSVEESQITPLSESESVLQSAASASLEDTSRAVCDAPWQHLRPNLEGFTPLVVELVLDLVAPDALRANALESDADRVWWMRPVCISATEPSWTQDSEAVIALAAAICVVSGSSRQSHHIATDGEEAVFQDPLVLGCQVVEFGEQILYIRSCFSS